MSNRGLGVEGKEVEVFAGVDVSAQQLTVAMWARGKEKAMSFANTAAGHRKLLQALLGKGKTRARVCLEATGNYHLDLCFALQKDARLELSVLNPRMARKFGESLGQRSKTDPVDARVLCEHARRMKCQDWEAPEKIKLELRSITRQMAGLTKMETQEKNRLHAVNASEALPRIVAKTVQRHLQYLAKIKRQLEKAALRLIASDPELSRRFDLLDSVKGVGPKSALMLLGELAVLPEMLDARQWVAHSGLDPRQRQSGSSVQGKPSISKAGNRRIRAALFLPALSAATRDPYVKAFYKRLQVRGKTKMQALVAVMRKLLHAVHRMFRTDQLFSGEKLCPLPITHALAA